jgi:hypothetical protein
MKTAIALVLSLGIALAIVVRIKRAPDPPASVPGSWEPADATVR